jgi:hypothetical protein
MKIHWDAVVEGATAGIIASILLALWAVLRDIIINYWLKRALRRELRIISCGHAIAGLTTEVRNLIGKEFTVREIVLVTDKLECPFTATGSVTSCLKEAKTKYTKDQMERLKKGEAIPVSLPRISKATWRVASPPTGFMTIAPFTKHEFLLPAEMFVFAFSAKPVCLRFTVEYESWTHKSTIVQQCTIGVAVKRLQQIFDFYCKELSSGNLNNARETWGLPKVKIPPTQNGTASKS